MAGRPGRPQAKTGAAPGPQVQAPERRLAAALDELQLPLDAVQQQRLLAHLTMLAKWNTVYNLTAIRDPAQMLTQHLFDCLAVVPALRHGFAVGNLLADGAVVLDVGSGGGLPGVVLAICAPGVQVHCVDAVAKKAAFIQQVKVELGLANLHAHHGRVEQLGEATAMPPVTLAISRAFASLADFINLTERLLAPGGCWAAMKGAMPEEELLGLPAGVRLSAAITLGVPQLDARRHLLLIERHAADA